MMNFLKCIKKMKWLIIIVVLTLAALAALTAIIIIMQCTNQNEYTAVVVEYHPVANDTRFNFEEYVLLNVGEYESIIKNSSEINADIIVFPEAGLTGTHFEKTRPFLSSHLIEVPDPISGVTPRKLPDGSCHEVLKKMSQAAFSHNIYVVINLPEKYNCSQESECPVDGYFFYNTNVVFDRQGCIIARYRKYNLFLEHEFSMTKTAELCTFQTDFGVTFGMFICFDILFENPAIQLLQLTNVKDIIYSTAWFSELPFLYATGVQAGWSHSMDVNLLASDLNDPSRKFGGSGIYAGKDGVKVALMPKETGTKIFSAKVPIRNGLQPEVQESFHYSTAEENKPIEFIKMGNNYSELEIMPDYSLPLMTSKILEPSMDKVYEKIEGVVFETVLNYSVAQFKSSIQVQWSINEEYGIESPRYRLFAYFGDRTFSNARNVTIAVCGIVACKNDTLDSCGLVPNFQSSVKTALHSIGISIRSKSVTEGYIPITSDFNIGPLSTKQFYFSKQKIVNGDNSIEYEVNMSSSKLLDNVLSFAVYKIPSI